ncbi:MAG: hypothetical protein ACI88H_003450 [Cocleimonas sp.]|jgi:hypothetical protein
MTRDEFWDISTFSPASSQMQTLSVSYCNTQTVDTVNPEITLLGSNPLTLNINDTFIDPGASATDNVDGDITNLIIPTSTVNAAIAGKYEVSYLVSDLAGNSTNISRVVIVSEDVKTDGIVIDGNTNDWNDITTFSSSSNAIMKVSDDDEKLYILITSSDLGANTQILMDTDNNAVTGLELSAQVNAWVAGADYMIENNSLDKSKSNTSWSWDYGVSPIEYIKTADTLEIAIKKADLNSISNILAIGFISRTESWNVNYVLPSQVLPTYTLNSPFINDSVNAENDSATTPFNTRITINFLANDDEGAVLTEITSSPSNGTLTIATEEPVRFIYTPNTFFTGIDQFVYKVTDLTNGSTYSATVKVIVSAPENNAPIAVETYATTIRDTAITIQVLANDSDPDGDLISIYAINQPQNGTAQIIGENIIYTPNQGFTGVDTFTYVITDGNLSIDDALVTVTVRDISMPPQANNDSATTSEDTAITLDVLNNDTSNSGSGQLTISSVGNPQIGTAQLVANQIIYTPVTFFTSIDSFTYTITDSNVKTATATITILVDSINRKSTR